MKYLLILLSILIFAGCDKDGREFYTINVKVITKPLPENVRVYITGNDKELGDWNPGRVYLLRKSDTEWSSSFSFPAGKTIEFKLTNGSWLTEALDSKGNIPPNFVHKVTADTTLAISVPAWNASFADGKLLVSARDFTENSPAIRTFDAWRYKKGDSPEYALNSYDDSGWEKVLSFMPADNMPPSGFDGIGWFRFSMRVDSSLWGKSVAFNINQLGASEIYFNGEFIDAIGTIGENGKMEKPSQNIDWRFITFSHAPDQVMAIRYANSNWPEQQSIGFSPGFGVIFSNLNNALSNTKDIVHSSFNTQLIFALIPLVLGVIHLLLFIFFPKFRQNLFYSFCLFSFAMLSYGNIQRQFNTDVASITFWFKMVPISSLFALLFGLFTAFSMRRPAERQPKRRWIYAAVVAVLSLVTYFVPGKTYFFIYALLGLLTFEMILSFRGFKKMQDKGGLIILAGFAFLVFFVSYQMLIDLEIVKSPVSGGVVFYYGILGFVIAKSIYLSYSFARTNKDLEKQLVMVKDLNEQALHNERIATEKEFEKRLLEIDNNRKTKELDDARKIQISMLPDKIPVVDYLDISVYMKTASEVGGDYYDFDLADDGTLSVVIGDATGHGAKAGILVAATKSLFKYAIRELDPLEVLKKFSLTIKSMKLPKLFIGLSVLKITDKKVIYANAGMPPLLWYNASKNEVEVVLLRGMPLGSVANFPYSQSEINLSKGDIILLMSDGFIETFNDRDEFLGIEKAKKVFMDNTHLSSAEIISKLVNFGIEWSNGKKQSDDITFLAIKHR